MEYHQGIQNRAGQTVAVINQVIPSLTVGTTSSAGLLAQSLALDGLAQTRDDALAAYDQANNAENQGFLAIRALTLSLPQTAEGDLEEAAAPGSALLDLLAPVYAIDPRTTELALKRGQKLVSALTKINAYLAGLPPTRLPITSGGKGITELIALMAAQPALEQAVEDRAADVTEARTVLRTAAVLLDRLNKRFYSRLKAEARTNATIAAALGQIETESANQPGTLGVKTILQGVVQVAGLRRSAGIHGQPRRGGGRGSGQDRAAFALRGHRGFRPRDRGSRRRAAHHLRPKLAKPRDRNRANRPQGSRPPAERPHHRHRQRPPAMGRGCRTTARQGRRRTGAPQPMKHTRAGIALRSNRQPGRFAAGWRHSSTGH
jgi:ribosomal protein S6E (S10)